MQIPPLPPGQSLPSSLQSLPSSLTPTLSTRIARVTGATPPGETLPNPNQTDRRDQIFGTDLGILWAAGDGTVLAAFGDSYGAEWGGAGAGPSAAEWRSNLLAVSRDLDPAQGLVFTAMIHDRPGHAGELIPARRNDWEHTIIPTAGIAVGSRQFLHFMSVHRWGVPGVWQTNLAGLAYSDNGGRTWTRPAAPVWENTPEWDDPFQQAAFAKSGGYIYLFGTPNGRLGNIFLARVSEARLLDKAAYRYWDGHGWKSEEAKAVPVALGPAGELSVAYNSFFRRWLMVAFDNDKHAVVLRDAPAPTGPWSAPKVLATDADYPGLYGGYIDPLHNSGRDLYFTLSLWLPYNVFWMHSTLNWITSSQD